MVRPGPTNLGVARYAPVNDKDYATRNILPTSSRPEHIYTLTIFNSICHSMDISSIVNEQSQAPQPPTQKAGQMILNAAIDSATPDRVRKVLKEVCADNPEAFEAACDKLLVDETTNGSSKRKRPDPNAEHRFEVCEQCECEYDVTDNPEKTCTWHPGKYTLPLQ